MQTKICSKCKKELPLTDFNWRDKKKGTHRSECKYCHSAFMKNKYQEKRIFVEELKSECKCAKCGETRGYVLDYHHINPEEKEVEVSRMISNKYALDHVENEISKCVVLCANCHREFHYFNKRNPNLTLDEYIKKK